MRKFSSHPTRVRGLKPLTTEKEGLIPTVAPHAGAWIETIPFLLSSVFFQVAPHAGAWIET